VIEYLREAEQRAAATRTAIRALVVGVANTKSARTSRQLSENSIYDALRALSQPLADSYQQLKVDLEDEDRISWAGTAHEIREVLRRLLALLAPDEKVSSQPWYVQDRNTSGPTQKQRVRYILSLQGAGSKETELAEQVVSLEDMIGDLVRSTYSRASDAAHRGKNRKEARRILRYFEAFAHDLLNLD
jgi:hypothetical protein